MLVDVRMRVLRLGERGIGSSGDTVAQHECLGEIFGRFELRRCLRGAENFQPRGAKRIYYARRQRRLGPDHCEMNFFLLCKRHQFGNRGDGHIRQIRIVRRAAVAGRDEDALNARRARELPRQCVFTTTVTNDE